MRRFLYFATVEGKLNRQMPIGVCVPWVNGKWYSLTVQCFKDSSHTLRTWKWAWPKFYVSYERGWNAD